MTRPSGRAPRSEPAARRARPAATVPLTSLMRFPQRLRLVEALLIVDGEHDDKSSAGPDRELSHGGEVVRPRSVQNFQGVEKSICGRRGRGVRRWRGTVGGRFESETFSVGRKAGISDVCPHHTVGNPGLPADTEGSDSNLPPTVAAPSPHASPSPPTDGLFHSLEILDTSGSHNFPAMRELSIRSGRAFIIVFAVNNEQSFYESQALWNLIKEVKGFDNVPCVLVGNKVDLSAEREVTWEEANNYVTEAMLNAAYVDTSAKYNLNVTLVFKELLVLTFGIGEEKKERRPSRIRLSLSDLSLTTRRKSSSAMSTGSGAAALSSSGISRTGSGLSSSSDCSPDDEKR
ncbi:putative GTP-binding protein di-Ras1 [Penaeus vannamei]|uniref:Putative GTP-binding protein di-Ras1 n=1 Tax=Penaeus vannamei TaxID=6689 RepID=A0A3R7N6K7_PENVA|nr:putative GTP-binding protein di-Ras1 [Penaeus vannamei]